MDSRGFAVAAADRCDALLPEARDALLLRRLNALLRYAGRRSPFYRERLPQQPLAALDELAAVPVLDRASFRAHAPPAGNGMLTRPADDCYVFASGGTTDQPRYVYRSHRENAVNCKLLAKGLACGGLRRGQVVANILAAGELWAGMWVFDKALEYLGSVILPLGSAVEPDALLRLLAEFRCDALIALPTQALALAGHAIDQGATLRIPHLVTGGEPLYPAAREQLAAALGVGRFHSTGYAANETGVIGYRCQAVEEGEFHLHEGAQYLEILDEAGQPAAPGQAGRLLVTNLYRSLMPIIRYDVGDVGCWLDGLCPCGRQSRRFRLLGRDGSRVRLGTSFFYPAQFAELIGRIPGCSLCFRLVISHDGRRDCLALEVEAAPGADAAALQNELRQLRDLAWEVQAGYAADPQVRLLPRGALPRNPRTGKIAVIDDQRGRG